MADALQALAAELNSELKNEFVPSTTKNFETKPVELAIELPTESVPATTGNSQAQSPLSQETNETPGTEVSDIEALDKEFSTIKKSVLKENARAKAATLSLVEQASYSLTSVKHTIRMKANYEKVTLTRAADFWRTAPIPAKNIAQLKTTDGPNGARGAIFKAGTKVRIINFLTKLY